jgi:hypothetical protein
VQKRAPVGANGEDSMYLLLELEREKDELRASLGTKKLEVATARLAWPPAPASVPGSPSLLGHRWWVLGFASLNLCDSQALQAAGFN